MFELAAVLSGHSADVRACCMDEQGHVITGSRDMTAIVWEQVPPAPHTPAAERWKIKCKFGGHTSYVNSVAVLPCSDQFPMGLIVTGGQDRRILVHCIGIEEPVNELKGHTGGVTCLSTGRHGTILSGSADTTIRVWLDMACVEELKGHTAPVWDVAIYPGKGRYLSASGDKTIRLWENGKECKIYTGHTDAVRKLLVLLDETFVSCSNDSTVRHWDVGGACLHSFTFGSSFLYSVSLLRHDCYALTGENGNLYIIENGEIKQGIRIPALSVWCSSPLPGGDLLVGGSDGNARIFTDDEAKFAPLPDREHMVQQIAAQKHSKKAIGDLEISKLQGLEGLHRPGKEGQTLMINNDGSIEVHQFASGAWQKIGVVQDAYDKDKHELDGQKYDFVIDVDVEDNRPPIKLGCNKGEDPWTVAQKFITKHGLPMAYLQQIAEYITQNTGLQDAPMDLSAEYSDPYTGAGRYVPSSVSGQGSGNGSSTEYCDPYTGGGRYVPPPLSPQGSGNAGNTSLGAARFYPVHSVSQEPVPDANKLIKKIRELNAEVNENCSLDTEQINRVEKITAKTSEGKEVLTTDDLNLVYKLLTWDKERLFPCLDLIRSINKSFPDLIPLDTKVKIGAENSSTTAVISCVRVALRLMVDVSCQHTQHCLEHFHVVVLPLMECCSNTTDQKYVSTSLTKILHNVSCVSSDVAKSVDILQALNRLLEYVIRELPDEKDRKLTTFLLLVTMGNLVTRHSELGPGVNKTLLQSLTSAQFDKTKITANDLLRQTA